MLDYGGRERAFPFYVVCDVSQTMWDPDFNTSARIPLDVLQDAVPDLIYRAELDQTICDAALISVIEFSSRAEVLLPLTRPGETDDLRRFNRGDQTDYAVVFDLLRRRIDEDCRRLAQTYDLKQPAVFFLTDGIPFVGDRDQPESVWLPARNRLLAPDFDFRPQLVAFGFGQARRNVLCRVASEQGGRRLAFIADRAMDVSEVLGALIDTLFISISASVAQGDLAVRVPEGMAWACPLAAG
ncbi:vWA domain-containing protein [Actinomadura monticuli]|uniref:VWA domain-containing protein n=1 Tax=Actinomadura monticuli TaxID=3097367 RepID=A0ABV4Q634_9ACTN